MPSYAEETLKRLGLDVSTDRIYALGTALRQTAAPYDREVMLYRFAASTGTYLGVSSLGSVSDESAGDLTIVAGTSAIVSGYVDPVGATSVASYAPDGSRIWIRELSGYGIGIPPPRHAVDADGNIVIMDQRYVSNDLSPLRLTRIATASGQVLSSLEAGTYAPRQVFTDAAGNFFINADHQSLGSTLMRVQPARLEFGDNNVIGGITYPSGRIDLPAPAEANQVWALVSANPSIVGVPATLTIPSGSQRAYFHYNVSPVGSITNVTINARHGGFIVQKALTVIPARLSFVSVYPNVVIGGEPTTGTIYTSGNAPSGGLTVALSTNKPSVASVTPSVIIPAGNYGVDVSITTYGVSANQGVVLSATEGSITKTAFFAVNAPSLTAIGVAPSSLKGGTNGMITLSLNGIAPVGGFSIVLFAGAPAVVYLPAAYSVPAGQTTVTFAFVTAPVTNSLNVLIFATRSGIYRTATVTVTP